LAYKAIISPLCSKVVAAGLMVMTVAGCAVGPDFRRPEAPVTDVYTEMPLPEKTASTTAAGGEEQQFLAGQDIPGQWWSLFHSEGLDRIIREALTGSPTVAAAQAALRRRKKT
jgi:outer membrane protein TolC